ncbi:hypothetical protein [Pseudomonas citronellolis]|uniref:hypothetical protein n=1 Tax=Pseudomonas citronellolis TaxID=53408 RepID=UPI0023E3FCC5|nr:hypothetical protein [Pseudomonas citronellolis]MDF3933687.1 hypothetical protein [Pseudomonas citronellolis]
MNCHFLPRNQAPNHIPQRAFGRFDHAEFSDDGTRALVAFDLVDAQWIEDQSMENEMFSLNDQKVQQRAWRRFIQETTHQIHNRNPFDDMPIYRLEITLLTDEPWFGLPQLPPAYIGAGLSDALADMEQPWIEFSLAQAAINNDPDMTGSLYQWMFEESIAVTVQGNLLHGPTARSLSTTFSLRHLPTISHLDLEALLASAQADWLVVFDVGQGNACALLQEDSNDPDAGSPMLYFDLGVGVYRNKDTTPANLQFGFYGNPPVVLSHWDSDHWSGAFVANANNAYPALQLQWIAPLQTVGPSHVAFAHQVRRAGGQFLIYDQAGGSVGVAPLQDGRCIRFMRGTGRSRNDSGLVMTIENNDQGVKRSWILTGDCDYGYFMPVLVPAAPLGLVAPHHGASLSPNTPVPIPDLTFPYRRLIYSFGQKNKHGRTNVQHPTVNGVSAHSVKDWSHNGWNPQDPGSPLAAGDVRSTCAHTPAVPRGGVLVGWREPQNLIQVKSGWNSVVPSTEQI